MFAYVAGSAFVLEDVYGVSPQAFSLVFAVNSASLVASSQLGARIVRRVGTATLLRYGLLGVGQFGTGALIAPLVGVAGSNSAVPMGLLIGACGLARAADQSRIFRRGRRRVTRLPPPSPCVRVAGRWQPISSRV